MMSEESKELLQVGIELMKRLGSEETVLPNSRYTNQWRNEVGVVSKQLKDSLASQSLPAYSHLRGQRGGSGTLSTLFLFLRPELDVTNRNNSRDTVINSHSIVT